MFIIMDMAMPNPHNETLVDDNVSLRHLFVAGTREILSVQLTPGQV